MLNFIGLIGFFCPCLVIHLRRVKANRNCLLPLYRHYKNKTVKSDRSDDEPVKNGQAADDEIQPTTTGYRLAIGNYVRKSRRSASLLRSPIVRVACLLIFAAYFIFNLVVIFHMGRANLPVMDPIPQQSYLRRHLEWHYKYFSLGSFIFLYNHL